MQLYQTLESVPKNERNPVVLSLAVASGAPVGVVIASVTNHLSCMYLWDTDSDTLTEGQRVRAKVFVEDISPDGKYVAYKAWAPQRSAQHWIGVSKPPYFTALAFFPNFHLDASSARFMEDGSLDVASDPGGPYISVVKGYEKIQERIDPGCPIDIHRTKSYLRMKEHAVRDERHRRRVFARGNPDEGLLVAISDDDPSTEQVIGRILRPTFLEVQTPERARVW